MIDGAAGEIAADGNADDGRRGPDAVGAPAHEGEFVMDLVHGGPDVVEELDLDYRLHAAHAVAHGAANDIGLAQGRVEDTLGAELGLQAGGEFEDPRERKSVV